MSGDHDNRQLDLMASITEVPQASSIELFISLLESLRGESRTYDALASLLEVEERTVRYYADFGRWLGWLQPAGQSQVELTERGVIFVESPPARGRLFARTLFERPLVQTVQRLKRERYNEHTEPEATRLACEQAVEAMTTLSEATAARRASSLVSMLRWAYRPRALDWTTGRPVAVDTTPFSFRGQSFLTAYAARQFGSSTTIYIGFPRQVLHFATGKGEGLRTNDWVRASYETDDGRARWFGSIPVNESTLAVARRQGPDLRRLLIACNPYLALLTALITSPSATHAAAMRLTDDMYGLHLWHRDRDLGPALEALARLAAAVDLIPVDTVPHLTGRQAVDDLRPIDDDSLRHLLVSTRLVRAVHTTLAPSPNVASELRLPIGDGPTIWERLSPLRQALTGALRDISPA